MLIGCGCNCAEDSVSVLPSGPSLASISETWPSQSQYENSTGAPGNFPCVTCQALVSSATYRVFIEGMQDQQPSVFGNYGCVEMLQTPYLLYPGAEQQYPWGEPQISRTLCGWMTITQASGPPAPPFGGYTFPGRFYEKHLLVNPTPGINCSTVPKTFFQTFRYGTTPPYTYQARLMLSFEGLAGTAGQAIVLTHVLRVFYKTPIFNEPLYCLNQFTLDWERAEGNLERQNPNGPGWESYGMGPGNNFSYEFDRGDFPQFIRVRPE